MPPTVDSIARRPSSRQIPSPPSTVLRRLIVISFANLLVIGLSCSFAIAADDAQPKSSATDTRPPNIIFILADDLGYGDLGRFGQQKIRTPNLDTLAAQGMRLTNHYCGNAVCAPSRCVLMTGYHPGHAQVRDNRGLASKKFVDGRPETEGQHPITADSVTIASHLKSRG